MLTLPPTVRVFLAPGATDMRKQFDGLAQVAREVIRQDPLSSPDNDYEIADACGDA